MDKLEKILAGLVGPRKANYQPAPAVEVCPRCKGCGEIKAGDVFAPCPDCWVAAPQVSRPRLWPVPPGLAGMNLENYLSDRPGAKQARQVAWQFLAAPANHRVLLIMGPADTGKTHLALGVARECRDAPAYCLAGDLIRSLRATYERPDLSYAETSQSLRSAPCLVLDYLHAPELTNDYAEDEIFHLLASRYDHLLPTIVTTVLRASDLSRCSHRVSRRLHRGLVLDLWAEY